MVCGPGGSFTFILTEAPGATKTGSVTGEKSTVVVAVSIAGSPIGKVFDT
jgi:hypothetical protein